MESLRERIHEQVARLDETLLPELAKTLAGLETKKLDLEATMALWEQFAESVGEGQDALSALLERHPLFGGRGLVFEPDA
jgi:hypothetical protein